MAKRKKLRMGAHAPTSAFGCIPDSDYLSTDYSDGQTTTTTRELAHRYVALYGPPLIPWRIATQEEINEVLAENARIASLESR